MSKRFRVALSFPGEKRPFIRQVADALAAALGTGTVLYDEYLTAELARPNLDVYLGQLYHDHSELLVPFFCAEYERKEWCGLEWRQMRDILKRKQDDHIMPFRFDDAPITGVLSIDGYVSIGDRSPQEVAELILQRLGASSASQPIVPEPTPRAAATSLLAAQPTPTRSARVYISYSYDSPEHVARVRDFATRLKADQIDCRLDIDVGLDPPEGWPAFSQTQIQDADIVISVCTETYLRRFDGREEPGRGKGVTFEGRLIRQAIFDSHGGGGKFIPVVFDLADQRHIPVTLRDRTWYVVSHDAESRWELNYQALLQRLRKASPVGGSPQPSNVPHEPNVASTLAAGAPTKDSRPANTTVSSRPMIDRPRTAMQQPAQSIIWLHLSDLHFCPEKTGWDAHRVLQPLLKDLKRMESDYGLSPQLLYFTGDAAFGNIGNVPGSTFKEQFDGAQQLLEAARTAFATPVPKENVFIVPGNHDVDRAEITADQTHWLETQGNATSVTALIQKSGKQWQQFMDRLAAYRAFLTLYGYDHLLSDADRLIYAQSRTIHGMKLGIAGFNSAWSCNENDRKGGLWFGGDWQSGKLAGQIADSDFRIALIHHPFGWFVEPEDTKLAIRFKREFAFHLHGHEHLGWVDATAEGHVRVAAAACYQSSHMENGYNFVRLNLETGEGEVWLREYEEDGGGWVPRIIHGKTNNDGLWRLPNLPWLRDLIRQGPPVNPP